SREASGPGHRPRARAAGQGGGAASGRLRSRDPAHPVGPLLPLPRPGRERAPGRAPARHAGCDALARRLGPSGGRAGPAGRARLEAEGLRPTPEADRATLIRRLSLDLTGLPPTPAEVDAFLADPAPGAYETAVDRLLASPHHGERMALDWLDVARFADTHGY